MSFLDEILDLEQEGVEVEAREMRARDWIPASAAMASHQAMLDGFNPGALTIDPRQAAPLDQAGIAKVAPALSAATSLQRILIKDQLLELPFRETADEVLDSSIKKGSKLIIRLTRANQREGSWSDIARKKLIEDGPSSVLFDNFSTSSVSVPDEERYQISETFGGNFIYGFGRRPQYLRISGQVLNGSMDIFEQGERRSHDWANALLRKYEDHFRLTRLIRNRMRCIIYCQDTIYTGFLLNLMPTVVVDTQNLMQISLTMVLSSRKWTRHEDESIAGTLLASGLYLPGKNTPDDYFQQARIESYFSKGYESVVEENKRLLREDLNAAIDALIARAGASGAGRRGIETVISTIPPQEQYYFDEVLQDRAHKVFRSDLLTVRGELARLRTGLTKVEQAKAEWVARWNPGQSFAVGAPSGRNVVAMADYVRIEAQESLVVAQVEAARQRQSQLNRIAENAASLYQQLSGLGGQVFSEDTEASGLA